MLHSRSRSYILLRDRLEPCVVVHGDLIEITAGERDTIFGFCQALMEVEKSLVRFQPGVGLGHGERCRIYRPVLPGPQSCEPGLQMEFVIPHPGDCRDNVGDEIVAAPEFDFDQ